ncbi:hypothetical protein AJ79_00511 [Helicocarpus griseus UAMH5409]|uniref:GH16 domain-containing protein n=1 Tax=Helicocarpus griseus UAMH5409 TaxID=1447875 RepID=A0A2B7YBL7_9EURO|nr:hypothetical protein AJ79_00511 [Helicocarpus griseus UAMH5409]
MKYLLRLALLSVLSLGLEVRGARPAKPNGDSNDAKNGTNRCQCYVVSGPEPGYFQNYKFYDFRSVTPEKTWSANITKSRPASNRTSNLNKEFRTRLEETGFLDDWAIQGWSRDGSSLFPIPIHNDRRNVFVLEDTTNDTTSATYLALRTQRLDNHTSTAEIETYARNFFRCSFRVRLRLHAGKSVQLEDVAKGQDDSGDGYWVGYEDEPDPDEDESNRSLMTPNNFRLRPPPTGAVAGIFTYHSVNVESDIEILTSDPHNHIHYANQPDWDPITDEMIPGASTVAELPIPWTSWATHRLDWFPDMTRWYLNNQIQDQKSYRVPNKPSMLVMNLWSDGGEWSGNMSIGSTVLMGIEWIEVAYNTSDMGGLQIESNDRTRPPKHFGSFAQGHTQQLQDASTKGKPKGRGRKKKPKPKYDDHCDVPKKKCQVGCRIDHVAVDGKPEILWDHYQPLSETPLGS